MDVRAGFDGAGRVGGWVPLNVQLVNEGSELKARVEVVVEQPGGRSTYSFVPTTFSLPMVLPRLSNRTFTMEVNLPNATNNRLAARLVHAPERQACRLSLEMARSCRNVFNSADSTNRETG